LTEDLDEFAGVEYFGAGLEDAAGLSTNDVSVVRKVVSPSFSGVYCLGVGADASAALALLNESGIGACVHKYYLSFILES